MVKDFGFWDCAYSISGETNGGTVQQTNQIAPADEFLVSKKIFSGKPELRFSYAEIRTEPLQGAAL
jgi:hypothetical protein